MQVEIEALGFTRGGAVADGHQLHVMFDTQCRDDGGGFGRLPGVWVDGVGGDQLAGRVDHGDFHPGAQARIEAHGGSHAGRRRHQQIVHVAGEHVDRFVFRALAHRAHQLGFRAEAP